MRSRGFFLTTELKDKRRPLTADAFEVGASCCRSLFTRLPGFSSCSSEFLPGGQAKLADVKTLSASQWTIEASIEADTNVDSEIQCVAAG